MGPEVIWLVHSKRDLSIENMIDSKMVSQSYKGYMYFLKDITSSQKDILSL